MRLIIDNSECWIKNVELPLNFNSMTYYGKLFYIYNNYLFHKLNGPARAFFSGAKYWYLDGLIVDEKNISKDSALFKRRAIGIYDRF